jgi:hypothetical protein
MLSQCNNEVFFIFCKVFYPKKLFWNYTVEIGASKRSFMFCFHVCCCGLAAVNCVNERKIRFRFDRMGRHCMCQKFLLWLWSWKISAASLPFGCQETLLLLVLKCSLRTWFFTLSGNRFEFYCVLCAFSHVPYKKNYFWVLVFVTIRTYWIFFILRVGLLLFSCLKFKQIFSNIDWFRIEYRVIFLCFLMKIKLFKVFGTLMIVFIKDICFCIRCENQIRL